MKLIRELRRSCRPCLAQVLGAFVAVAISACSAADLRAQCGSYVILMDEDGRPVLHSDGGMSHGAMSHPTRGAGDTGGRIDFAALLLGSHSSSAKSDMPPCEGIRCRRSGDESISSPPPPTERRRDLPQMASDERRSPRRDAGYSSLTALELLVPQETGSSLWRPPKTL